MSGATALGATPVGVEPKSKRRAGLDPLVLFQVYMLLLVLSPSIYIIQPLGAAGTPATIMGCGMFLLWLIERISGSKERLGLTPLHWAVGGYALAMLVAFVTGMLRPISGIEVSSALRGLISLVSAAGVMLLTADSIRTRERLTVFLGSATTVGAILAGLGIVQFFAGVNFVEAFHLPGLTQNSELTGLYERSGFPRVSATALHSIEFAAVIGMILPVAAHQALNSSRKHWWRWLPFVVMIGALPLTVARSGAVSLIIGLTFALIFAYKRQRMFVLVAVIAAAVAFRSALPGLLGTIRSLFTGASEDNSIAGRVDDFAAVAAFFGESPWIGRGFSTFLPSIYRTLDNQFLAIVIEAGIVGLLAALGLFLVSVASCVSVAAQARSRYARTEAWGVAVGIGSAFLLSLTFDLFGFPMAFGMLGILLGASGAVWRVHQSEGFTPARRNTLPPLSRRGWLAASVLVVTILGVSALAVSAAEPDYEARRSLLLRGPLLQSVNELDQKVDLPGLSGVVSHTMDSEEVRAALEAEGVEDYSVAIGSGSLGPRTDVVGVGEMMQIAARAPTPEQAIENARLVRAEIAGRLSNWQSSAGVPTDVRARIDDSFAPTEVFERSVSRPAAVAGALLLAGIAGLMFGHLLRLRDAYRRGQRDLAADGSSTRR